MGYPNLHFLSSVSMLPMPGESLTSPGFLEGLVVTMKVIMLTGSVFEEP